MGRKIICLDDSANAKTVIARVVVEQGYDYSEIDLERALHLDEWTKKSPSQNDLFLVDISLRLKTSSFSGRDVIEKLGSWVTRGQLPNPKGVLVNTTLESELNQPYIVNAPGYELGFNVYTLKRPTMKGSRGQLDLPNYRSALINTIGGIYSGQQRPVNAPPVIKR